MDNFKYSLHAQSLDDALVAELKEHRDARALEQADREELSEKESGMDFIAGGRSPREVVEEIVREKRERAADAIREHEVGKKMAAMASAGRNAVDSFLSLVDEGGADKVSNASLWSGRHISSGAGAPTAPARDFAGDAYQSAKAEKIRELRSGYGSGAAERDLAARQTAAQGKLDMHRARLDAELAARPPRLKPVSAAAKAVSGSLRETPSLLRKIKNFLHG